MVENYNLLIPAKNVIQIVGLLGKVPLEKSLETYRIIESQVLAADAAAQAAAQAAEQSQADAQKPDEPQVKPESGKRRRVRKPPVL